MQKGLELQGALPPDPPPGALFLDARWGLRPQTPVTVIGHACHGIQLNPVQF